MILKFNFLKADIVITIGDNFISTNKSFLLNMSGTTVDVSDMKDLLIFKILLKIKDKISNTESITNNKAQSVESYFKCNLSESSVRKWKRNDKDINNSDIAIKANPADDIISKNPYTSQ